MGTRKLSEWSLQQKLRRLIKEIRSYRRHEQNAKTEKTRARYQDLQRQRALEILQAVESRYAE